MNYDLIILGGGPAGYTGAVIAGREGLKVALIEQDNLGGVCLNKGCIPTKTLLKSADIYYSSVNSNKFGVYAENVSYDMDKIFERKNEVVSHLVDGINKLVSSAGVTLIKGRARFVSSNAVEVNGEKLTAKHLMIATGGSAIPPPINGIEYALTSDDVLNGKATGEKIVIVGGGVIGVEFATFFKKLGKTVTIVEIAERILPQFDRDLSLNLAMCLKKLGIEIICQATVNEICENKIKYTARSKEAEMLFDSIIVCTGRRANIADLGLENTSVKYDKYGIYVNKYQHTADNNIYAVGDVVAKNIQLAHNASAEAETVIHNILNGDTKTKPKHIPSCVYTSPEVAIVGISEKEAIEKGIEIETGKFPMGANGKAVLSGEDRGFIKVIFNKNTQQLIGVQLLSENATDIIGAITTLVESGVKREEILNSVYPHPTIVEAFYEAVLDSEGKAIHIMNKRR